jgi:hypothetical protein
VLAQLAPREPPVESSTKGAFSQKVFFIFAGIKGNNKK